MKAPPSGPFSSASALNLNEAEATPAAQSGAQDIGGHMFRAAASPPPSAEVEAACELITQIVEPMAEQAILLMGADRKLMDSLVDRMLGIAILLRRLAETPKAASKRCPHYWDTQDNGCLLAEDHEGPHSFASTVSATAGGDAELCMDLRCLGQHSEAGWLDMVKTRAAARIEEIIDERKDWARRFTLNGVAPWIWMMRAEAAERLAEQRGELLRDAAFALGDWDYGNGREEQHTHYCSRCDNTVDGNRVVRDAIDAALSREPAQGDSNG